MMQAPVNAPQQDLVHQLRNHEPRLTLNVEIRTVTNCGSIVKRALSVCGPRQAVRKRRSLVAQELRRASRRILAKLHLENPIQAAAEAVRSGVS